MSPAKSENANRAEKRDHRREVTDSIIKMLEDGVAPWQKPWEGSVMPFNPTTERPYRGGNALHLLATGMGREYADPRWMTYKQAAEQGWQVRGGEKGTHIEFWEVKERSNDVTLVQVVPAQMRSEKAVPAPRAAVPGHTSKLKQNGLSLFDVCV